MATEYDTCDNAIDLQMITNKTVELGAICYMQYEILIGITNDCNKNMSLGIVLLCNISLVSWIKY